MRKLRNILIVLGILVALPVSAGWWGDFFDRFAPKEEATLSGGNAGIIDWLYNRDKDLLYGNNNIDTFLIGGTATTSAISNFEVQGGAHFDNATTTGSLSIGGDLSVSGDTTLIDVILTNYLVNGNSTTTGYSSVGTADSNFNFTAGDLNASGELHISEGGVIMGNLGIGTTTPLARISVQGGGNNVLKLASSLGTELVTVQNDGNVGIGTTSPNSLLQVARSSGGTETLFKVGTSTNDDLLEVRSNGNVLINGGNVGIGTTTPYTNLSISGTGSSEMLTIKSTDGYPQLKVESYNNDWVKLTTGGGVGSIYGSYVLSFGQGSTERMRINYDGNVGIGTTGPGEKLTVVGSINLASTANGYIGYDNRNNIIPYSSTYNSFIIQQAPEAGRFIGFRPDNGAFVMAIDTTTGNVGIGDTSPDAKFELTKTTGNENALFMVSSTTDGDLLTINNNGNVGIGTTSPDFKLQVNGSIVSDLHNTDDLGKTGTRWANVYATTYYGDGSNLTGISGAGITNLNAETLGSIGDVSTTTLAYGSMLVWDTANWNSSSTLPYLETEWNKLYNATTTLSGFTNNQANWNTAYGWGNHAGLYLLDSESDIMTGTLTADGLTIGSTELLTIGSNTLTHNGTDFVFNDTVAITGYATSTSGLNTQGTLHIGSNGIIEGTLDVNGRATTTGQFFVEGERVIGFKSPGFSYSSSTLSVEGAYSATGTTTQGLPMTFFNEQWDSIYCYTDTGTTTVRFGDGTNYTGYYNCPRYQADAVANNTITPTPNNTFTTGERPQVQIGSQLGNPNRIHFTIKKQILAD